MLIYMLEAAKANLEMVSRNKCWFCSIMFSTSNISSQHILL